MSKKCCSLLLAFVLLLAPVRALAQKVSVDEACSGVFRVAVRDANGSVTSFGSAFYVGNKAGRPVLLTNYHVVSPNTEGVCLWLNAEKEIRCTLLKGLEDVDLAILEAEKELQGASILPLGSDEWVTVGDDVYALGFPTVDISDSMTSYANDVSVSKGVISKRSTWMSVPYYQIDAAINAGNSGGPLLHASGSVVGICTLKMDHAEGIGGAVMIEEALALLKDAGVEYVAADSPSNAPTHTNGVETPIPVTTLSPQERQESASAANNAAGRSLVGVWIGVFAVSALLLVVLSVWLLLLRHRKNKSMGDAEPMLKKVRGYVVGKSGAYAGAVISVGSETVFFGRDPQQCQMVFDSSQLKISRVHCSLRYDEQLDCFFLENYSGNGTYLGDGREIEQGRPHRLSSGDSFYLANGENLFELIDKKSGPVSFWTRGAR